jgi:hypothetical protein
MSDSELKEWAESVIQSEKYGSRDYGLALGIKRLLAEKADQPPTLLYGFDSFGNIVQMPRPEAT